MEVPTVVTPHMVAVAVAVDAPQRQGISPLPPERKCNAPSVAVEQENRVFAKMVRAVDLHPSGRMYPLQVEMVDITRELDGCTAVMVVQAAAVMTVDTTTQEAAVMTAVMVVAVAVQAVVLDRERPQGHSEQTTERCTQAAVVVEHTVPQAAVQAAQVAAAKVVLPGTALRVLRTLAVAVEEQEVALPTLAATVVQESF